MNLIHKNVKHEKFGMGKIIEQNDTHITVEFPLKTSKFKYPFAFEEYIKAEDELLQTLIIKEIEEAKAAEIEKEKVIAKSKETEEKILQNKSSKTEVHSKAATTKPTRIANKSMTFFVFQGNTFDQESKGRYMWAPITNKEGSNIHHWNRMLDVRVGDIILHGCNGTVVAISSALTECYDCPQPEELRDEDLWDRDGRRVDCDYVVIRQPIKTADYKEEIVKLSAAKYSPFDRNGSGNMGYLYEINRELARKFIMESLKLNKYLLDYDFIKDFLNEQDAE